MQGLRTLFAQVRIFVVQLLLQLRLFGFQLAHAFGLGLARFAPRASCPLETVQIGRRHAWGHIHPAPAFGLHRLDGFGQPLAGQFLQQAGIGQEDTGLVVREQIAPYAAARRFIGQHTDEARQRIAAGVDLVAGQVIAQGFRAALPLGHLVERGFLRRMVVGDRQGHQLLQRDLALLVVGQQPGRDIGQPQPPLDHQRCDPEVRRNVFQCTALGHQCLPGKQFVHRRHGFALHVLGQAHGAGRRVGHLQTGHRVVLVEFVALDQQFQRSQPPTPGHHLERQAIGRLDDGQVLQQAQTGDGRCEFGDGRVATLAHVAAGRPQARERDQMQLIGCHLRDAQGFIGSDCCVNGGSSCHGVQRQGFGLRNGVHVKSPAPLGALHQ
ncbi:hypothetical protein Y695_03114 [Hydrogenophaga sp. T4]|nr:hypothetical protein Y695_03114 [Hydrogenophaga sp. T4]